MDSIEALMSLKLPMHVVVTKSYPDGTTVLVGSQFLEWRKVIIVLDKLISQALCSEAGVNSWIELTAMDTKVAVGLVNCHLKLFPPLSHTVSQEQLALRLTEEKMQITREQQIFRQYALDYWNEYSRISPSHRNRLVKIFALTEDNQDIPVCAFVTKMTAGRLLHSARHAARFVSLIPFEGPSTIGSTT